MIAAFLTIQGNNMIFSVCKLGFGLTDLTVTVMTMIIPPANCVWGVGYTVLTSFRPSVFPSATHQIFK